MILVNISIHAPRTGSDIVALDILNKMNDFNPRSPHGERHRRLAEFCYRTQFQSTLPARGATGRITRTERHASISIHAPRTGSDDRASKVASCRARFQSTLPARGATFIILVTWGLEQYFNPRSPHGERPSPPQSAENPPAFQSTLPARGATYRPSGRETEDRKSVV